jgi:hypothetical protein
MPAWCWRNISTENTNTMQVYCNEKYVKSRAKLGRYASFAGMGVLLVGLIITWTAGPEGLALSFLALIGGFVLSQVGLYYANRFGRPERPDQVLAKSLKGFDDRYNLFQYTSPAGNVLVTPSACLVFTVKMQRGPIRYQNGKWKHSRGFRSILLWLGSDSLGNPSKEAELDADTMRRYVAKKLPGVEIPIQPVILFGNPTAEVDASGSPVPAVHYKKLKDWLRGPGKGGTLSAEARDQLIALLSPPEAIIQPEQPDEEQSDQA